MLNNSEIHIATLIWELKEVSSGELAKICESNFGWKKSTTYTNLKRMIDKGFVANIDGKVSMLLDQDEYLVNITNNFMKISYQDNLVKFLQNYLIDKNLTQDEFVSCIQLLNERLK